MAITKVILFSSTFVQVSTVQGKYKSKWNRRYCILRKSRMLSVPTRYFHSLLTFVHCWSVPHLGAIWPQLREQQLSQTFFPSFVQSLHRWAMVWQKPSQPSSPPNAFWTVVNTARIWDNGGLFAFYTKSTESYNSMQPAESVRNAHPHARFLDRAFSDEHFYWNARFFLSSLLTC